MAQAIGMSDEVRELRARMKDFIDNVVFKAEPELERQSEHGFHPDTGPADRALRGGRGARRRHVTRRARARATPPAGAAPASWPTSRPRPRSGACGRSAIRPRSAAAACRSWTSSTSTRSSAGPSTARSPSGSATHAGLDHAAPLRQRRAARAVPRPAGGRRRVPVASASPSPRSPAATRPGCRRRAYLDGDEWVINGHKWFTSGASRAAFTTVFAKTEPDAEKHMQFSSIIVPTDTPGYLIQRAVPDDGPRRRPALRGRLRQRPRARARTCSATAARASSSARSASARAASSTACAGSVRPSGRSS